MREFTGPYRAITYVAGIILVLWSFVTLTFYPVDPLVLRGVHLGIAMFLVFLLFPATKSSPKDRPTLFDLIWSLFPLAMMVYVVVDSEKLAYRVGSGMPNEIDIVLGTIMIVLALEVARRVAGMALVIVGIFAILYALFGNHIPGIAGHRGYQWARIISIMFSEDGILGSAVQVAATYALLFITFGSFLTRTGISDFINDFAQSLLGGQRGGPAKVAVVASGLFGMVSGNSAGNVATTGTITIPMMKRVGYKPEFAGAVEAAASAGGQIMPPVLGSVVFLMVALTGISYREFMIISVFPALIYYAYVYYNVDFEASNLGLQGLPRSELPPLWPIIKRQAFLVAPVPVLCYTLVVQQAPIITAVLWSIFVALIAGYVNSFVNKKRYMAPRDYADAIHGGSSVILITAVTAVAGLMIGVIMLTGIGVKLGGILSEFTGGNLLLSLLLCAALSIILGCGMPALPAYVITAAIMAPVLEGLGVQTIVAHFFIFFYSALSTITPPVAISAYVGAGIAGADPIKTGLNAVKIAGIAWFVPFMLVYSPALAMQGSIVEIVMAVIPTLIGGYGMARGIGHVKTPWPARILFGVGGVMGVLPEHLTDMAGMVVIACAFVLDRWLTKRRVLKEQSRAQPLIGD